MNQIHGLFIGINQYKNQDITFLHGCVNDATRMRDFIAEHWKGQIADAEKQLLLTTNEQASKQGIIEAFGQLKQQLEEDDHLIIYYSGHGSRSKTAPELRNFSEGEMDESWVCHDSRTSNAGGNYIYDLRDKEIAHLISQFPQLATCLFISDSCHSASITRDAGMPSVAARFHGDDKRPTTIGSYLGYGMKPLFEAGITSFAENPIPYTEVISLSACSRHEKAWEVDGRGVFTNELLRALGKQPDISYSELLPVIRANVVQSMRNRADQTPQLEAYGRMSTNKSFLGKANKTSHQRLYPIAADRQGTWNMEYGVGNGLKEGSEGVFVKCYSDKEGKKPVGEAMIDLPFVTHSNIRWKGKEPEASQAIFGQIEHVNKYHILAHVEAEAWSKQMLKPISEKYPNIQLVDIDLAQYIVREAAGKLNILEAEGKVILSFPLTAGFLPEYVLGALDQLGYYQHIIQIANRNSFLQKDISFHLELGEEKFEAKPYLHVKKGMSEYGKEHNIDIRLSLDSRIPEGEEVYIGLVYLNPDFGIRFLPFGQNEKKKLIAQNDDYQLFKNKLYLDEKRGLKSVSHFKLLVSHVPFDETLLEKANIDSWADYAQTRGDFVFMDLVEQILSWCGKTFSVELYKTEGQLSI